MFSGAGSGELWSKNTKNYQLHPWDLQVSLGVTTKAPSGCRLGGRFFSECGFATAFPKFCPVSTKNNPAIWFSELSPWRQKTKSSNKKICKGVRHPRFQLGQKNQNRNSFIPLVMLSYSSSGGVWFFRPLNLSLTPSIRLLHMGWSKSWSNPGHKSSPSPQAESLLLRNAALTFPYTSGKVIASAASQNISASTTAGFVSSARTSVYPRVWTSSLFQIFFNKMFLLSPGQSKWCHYMLACYFLWALLTTEAFHSPVISIL